MHVALAGEVLHSRGDVSAELEELRWEEGELRVGVDLRPGRGGEGAGSVKVCYLCCVLCMYYVM